MYEKQCLELEAFARINTGVFVVYQAKMWAHPSRVEYEMLNSVKNPKSYLGFNGH